MRESRARTEPRAAERYRRSFMCVYGTLRRTPALPHAIPYSYCIQMSSHLGSSLKIPIPENTSQKFIPRIWKSEQVNQLGKNNSHRRSSFYSRRSLCCPAMPCPALPLTRRSPPHHADALPSSVLLIHS